MPRRKESQQLPESAVPILHFLADNGKTTQSQLIEKLRLPTRKARYAVSRLLEKGLILRKPNLNDMRSVYYQVAPQIIDIDRVVEDGVTIEQDRKYSYVTET